MKTVDFTNFTVKTTNGEKQFFEEGSIHNEMEMLSIVDARKHYLQRYNDDPFFETNPDDIEYILDLYQKLELFEIGKIDFDRLYNSIAFHSHGSHQPIWLHWDGAITEMVGNDFEIPIEQETNPVVAVFRSSDDEVLANMNKKTVDCLYTAYEHHIKDSIQSKMIEIEAEHLQGV